MRVVVWVVLESRDEKWEGSMRERERDAREVAGVDGSGFEDFKR